MAKAARKSDSVPLAGFTVAEWKHHMDHDEDWSERLDGADDAIVREIVDALRHTDAAVRALACNLVYGLGVSGLGVHATSAVETLGNLGEDKDKKVRTRARLVHETLASELARANVQAEFPWLQAYDPGAHGAALAALDDTRDEVRLQTCLWWAHAADVPSDVGSTVADKLSALIARESDDVRRRAAELAQLAVRPA